jgi:dihydrodipicolinate synthase/N-acetylneuraminate lyase
VKPLTADTLRGTWGTILLPLNRDDSVDFELLGEELAVLAEAGLDGVYTNGTAGEFHTLDEAEYDRVTAFVAERCARDGVALQLGASHMSGQISLGRILRSVGYAPGAIQIILPDWLPLATDEILAAVERMAQAAEPVPIVLYNPPHAKTKLTPEQFGRLADAVPQLIGIKVAGGDATWFAAMRAHAPRLSVFVAGHTLASGMRQGASGAYSNVACLSPRGAAAWHRMACATPSDGEALEARIRAFLDRHIMPWARQGHSNTALDKALARIGGWAPMSTRTRWPYRAVPEAAADALAPVARQELPELFDNC